MEKDKQKLSNKINKALKENAEKADTGGIWITHRAIWEKAGVVESVFYEALKGNCGIRSMEKIIKALEA